MTSVAQLEHYLEEHLTKSWHGYCVLQQNGTRNIV